MREVRDVLRVHLIPSYYYDLNTCGRLDLIRKLYRRFLKYPLMTGHATLDIL